VPFWLPHFVAPRLFCPVTAKREGNEQDKEIVKLVDGYSFFTPRKRGN
jgi:hypothetical protein